MANIKQLLGPEKLSGLSRNGPQQDPSSPFPSIRRDQSSEGTLYLYCNGGVPSIVKLMKCLNSFIVHEYCKYFRYVPSLH